MVPPTDFHKSKSLAVDSCPTDVNRMQEKKLQQE